MARKKDAEEDQASKAMVPYVEYAQPVKIEQNDTLSIMSAA